jgi:hypothetical protein
MDCGFKLCRKRAIDKIKPIKSIRAGDVELLVKAKKYGFRIKQVGVRHFSRPGGKSEAETLFNLVRPKVVYLVLKDTIRLRKVVN